MGSDRDQKAMTEILFLLAVYLFLCYIGRNSRYEKDLLNLKQRVESIENNYVQHLPEGRYKCGQQSEQDYP